MVGQRSRTFTCMVASDNMVLCNRTAFPIFTKLLNISLIHGIVTSFHDARGVLMCGMECFKKAVLARS